MKSALLVVRKRIEIRDVPYPEISPDSIILKVISASICNNTDYRIYSAPDPTKIWPGIDYPVPMGHECCGEIVEVGRNMKDKFKEGQFIALWGIVGGAFSEYVKLFPEKCAIVKVNPEKLSPRLAAPLEMVFGTTGNLFDEKFSPIIKQGNRVVIFGLGPAGLFFLQLSKILGAEKVICIGKRHFRMEKAKELGADIVIDAGKENYIKRVKEKVDVVINATGRDIIPSALSVIKEGGHFVPFGNPPDWSEKKSILLSHNIKIFQIPDFSYIKRIEKYVENWVEERKIKIKPLCTHFFTLEELVEKNAIELAKSDPSALKIIISPY